MSKQKFHQRLQYDKSCARAEVAFLGTVPPCIVHMPYKVEKCKMHYDINRGCAQFGFSNVLFEIL